MSEEERKEKLAKIQKAIKEKKGRWTAGETKLSKLPENEVSKYLGSKIPEERVKRIKEKQKVKEKKRAEVTEKSPIGAEGVKGLGGAGAPPPTWDWRNVSGIDWCGTVKTQGGCGSCVSFAVVGTLEMMLRKHVYNDATANIDLSEAHLFFCNSRQCNPSDPNYGWWIQPALDYLKANGIPDESCFGYTASNQPCNTCTDWRNRIGHTKVSGWRQTSDTTVMKNWLRNNGCLVADFAVFEDFLYYYTGGVYEYVSGLFLGGHAIMIVGYDDTNSCWICKNSWGDWWGENGYFRVGYDEVGLDDVMYAIDVVNWPNGQTVNAYDTSPYPPAAIPFNNKLYLFWKANDYGNRIYWSASPTGSNWPNGKQINTYDTSPYPVSATVFNNKLYLFWKANDSSNRIYYSASNDGVTWPNGKQVNTYDTSPYWVSATVFNNKLYLFWKANDYGNKMYYSASSNGVNWPNGQTVNAYDTSPYPPAAIPFNNKLYLFWKANDYGNRIYWSASPTGSNWPNGKQINTYDTSPYPVSATVFNNKLYLFWKANDYGNGIYYSASSNGTNWPNALRINSYDSTPKTPFVAVHNSKLFLFWKSNDPGNKIFYGTNDI